MVSDTNQPAISRERNGRMILKKIWLFCFSKIAGIWHPLASKGSKKKKIKSKLVAVNKEKEKKHSDIWVYISIYNLTFFNEFHILPKNSFDKTTNLTKSDMCWHKYNLTTYNYLYGQKLRPKRQLKLRPKRQLKLTPNPRISPQPLPLPRNRSHIRTHFRFQIKQHKKKNSAGEHGKQQRIKQ